MKFPLRNLPLLALISLNQYGTQLSSFLGFASIGLDNNDLLSLSMALALKTLAIAFCSYYASRFILKLNAQHAIIISQIGGIFSTLVLWLALEFRSIPWTIAAILLSGIPAVIFGNAMTLLLRRSLDSESEFRKTQATRGSFAACTFIVTGITWPWMHLTLSWKGILVVDIATYCVALLLLRYTPTFKQGHWDAVDHHPEAKPRASFKGSISAAKKSIFEFNSEGMLSYLLRILVIYAGVGLIPLIASSQEFIHLSRAFAVENRGFFWAIEAVSLFAANLVYRMMQGWSKALAWILGITSLSHILLYLGVISTNFYLVLVLTFLGRTFMETQALLYRDRQILKAKTIQDQVHIVSTISSVHGLVMALSPLVLYVSYSSRNLATFFLVIGGIQTAFWLLNNMPYALKRGSRDT